MYKAWNKHGVKPSEIYKMSKGEQNLLRAFLIIESEYLEKR